MQKIELITVGDFTFYTDGTYTSDRLKENRLKRGNTNFFSSWKEEGGKIFFKHQDDEFAMWAPWITMNEDNRFINALHAAAEKELLDGQSDT